MSKKMKGSGKPKTKKVKRLPFGGKVANIEELIVAISKYGKKNETDCIPPTEVTRITWKVIKAGEE